MPDPKEIKRKPTGKVTSLATPKRTGNTYKMNWVVPDWLKSDQNEERPIWCDCEIRFESNKGKLNKVESIAEKGTTGDAAVRALMKGNDLVWYRRAGHWLATSKEDTYQQQTINRQLYHPFVKGKYLLKVWGTVFVSNRLGYGPKAVSGTFTLKVPRKPKIATPSLNASTQRLTAKVTTDAGTDACERYDTMYCITRRDNFKQPYSKKATIVTKVSGKASWASTTATEVTPGFDAGEALKLSLGQWIEVTFKAYARGIRGNSDTATRTHVLCHPAKAKITGIAVDKTSSGAVNTTGLVHIAIKSNSSAHRLVDRCVLQRLKDTDASTSAAASTASGWEDVEGQVDNANCLGFTDAVSDAITLIDPTTGKYTGYRTWYRIATYHDNMPPQYSEPSQATDLHHAAPTAADDTVAIESAQARPDGTSIEVMLKWTADDSVATEVSWSTDPDAWDSTEQPDSFDVGWVTSSSGSTRRARLVIHGLDEGVPVFVRARRHDAAGTFGAYSDTAQATPQSTPANVQLSLPSFVPRGRDLQASWTFDGSEQKAWHMQRRSGNSWLAIADGSDASGSCAIQGALLEGFDSLELRVGVSSGGGWAHSEPATVQFVDAPELGIEAGATLAAQPFSFAASCSSQAARLIAKVQAVGISWEGPAGTESQAAGETVWSALVEPEWEQVTSTEVVGYEFAETADTAVDATKTYYASDEAEGTYAEVIPEGSENPAEEGWYELVEVTEEVASGYTAAYELPPALGFRDGGAYTLTVQAVDADTGLASEEAVSEFNVAWAHQAEAPSATIEPDVGARTCRVFPIAPSGAAETDLCDVYRVTPDGAYLIAEGVQFGGTVIDRFAPFSGTTPLSYRVATRTTDGDMAWADVPYTMALDALRLDWGGKHVELDRNITISSSGAKDFEERPHMDGTHAGYWNAGSSHSASLSGAMIRLESAEQAALLADMGRHAGAVFVRTPEGAAFQANVDLAGLETTHASALRTVMLSATEVALTGEFMAGAGDVIEPGSTEEPSDWEDDGQ